MVEADEVVAFGGYELSPFYSLGTLVFGLVRADRHGAGIGRALLHYRLLHMAGRKLRPRYVTVDTHPHTAGFFERSGFVEIARWPGGYRSGRDRVDLRFELSDEAVDKLRAGSASRQHQRTAILTRLRRSRAMRSSAGRMARTSAGVQVGRPLRKLRRRLTSTALPCRSYEAR